MTGEPSESTGRSVEEERENNNTGRVSRSKLLKIGRYQVIDQLGQGGMGIVVKASHQELDKLVAIKVLNSNLLVDETSLRRFEIEAKAGSQLSHPSLVSIFDYGVTDDGSPYLVMEYIEGRSLQEILAEAGKLSGPMLVKVFEQIAKALQYIHKRGVVHRDIKASNIMLQDIDGDLYAKLVDFGIAKVIAENGGQKLTETGSVFGSPFYMSPEQCQGNQVDARSDIYSLGCVMYECYVGHPPIQGENALKTIFMHVTHAPEPLQDLNSTNPAARNFARMIHKCLEKSPSARYQNCAQLLQSFNEIKEAIEAQKYQSSSPPAQNRWKRTGERSSYKLGTYAPGTIPSSSNGAMASSPGAPATISPQAHCHTQPPVPVQSSTAGPSSQTFENSLLRPRADMEELQKRDEDHRRLTNQMRLSDVKRENQKQHGSSTKKIVCISLAALAGAIGITCGALVVSTNLQQSAQKEGLKKAVEAFNLGTAHFGESEPLFQKALETAKKTNNARSEAQIHCYLGKINLHNDKPDEAYKNFEAALKLLDPQNETSRNDYLQAMVGRADAQLANRKLAEAKADDVKALKLAQEWNSDSNTKGDILLSSARVAAVNGKKPNISLSFFDRAISEYEKRPTENADKKITAWLESAELAQKFKWTAEAVRRAEKSLEQAKKIASETDRREFVRRAEALTALGKESMQQAHQAANQNSGIHAQQSQQLNQTLNQQSLNQQFQQVRQQLGQPSGVQPYGVNQQTWNGDLSGLSSQPPPQNNMDLEQLKVQNQLQQQRLEEVERARELSRELTKIQQESFRNVTDQLRRQSRSAN